LIVCKTGSVAKLRFQDLAHLFVQGAQGNICWTRLLAQAAIYAPAGHMHGPSQVKSWIGWRDGPSAYQLTIFQAAFFAKANRTNVPATEAFDAFLKFLHPVGKAVLDILFLQMLYGSELAALNGLPGHVFIRIRLLAFTGLGQLLGAGDAHGHNMFSFDLVPDKERVQAPLVASPDQDAEGLIRIGPGQTNQDLIQGVSGLTWAVQIPKDHVFQLLRGSKQMGANMAVALDKANEPRNVFSGQKLFDLGGHFVNHR
jgi:hypothetical protein